MRFLPTLTTSRRTTRVGGVVAAGALVGAALGTAFAGSVAALTGGGGADEGAGYGGNSSALRVTVEGEQVRVEGVGFAAQSPVEVTVGHLSTTVVADDVGAIDALLTPTASASGGASTSDDVSAQNSADGAGAPGSARATGTGADGTPATLTEKAAGGSGSGTSGGALGGALVGGLGAVAWRRRSPE